MQVSAVSATALTALQLIAPKDDAVPSRKTIGSAADPSTGVRLSPSVSDAIMKIGQIVGAARLADLPAEHARRLKALGADAAERVAKPVVSDAEFQSRVLAFVKETGMASVEGFSEALANGTLRIQRASDVKGLGYESIQYKLYSGGNMIGGAGWDTINREFYDAVAATGVRQGLGTVEGLDYYMTW